MKKNTLSDVYLLEIAKAILTNEGLDALSIRRLATEAGVAIGSVYNYYESKDALMDAVTKSLWESVFIEALNPLKQASSYVDAISQAYTHLRDHIDLYHTIFTGYYRSLTEDAKKHARKTQHANFKKINSLFMSILEHDHNVDATIWHGAFTMEEYNRFIVRSLLGAMQHHEANIDFILALIETTLYPDTNKVSHQ